MTVETPAITADPEAPRLARFAYARVLRVLVPAVFGLCALAFLVYVAALVKPLVPLGQSHRIWSMSAGEALRAQGLHAGWGWLKNWRFSDTFCLAALGLLTVITPLACAAATIQYLRRREWVLAVVALAQFALLAFVLSGQVVAR